MGASETLSRIPVAQGGLVRQLWLILFSPLFVLCTHILKPFIEIANTGTRWPAFPFYYWFFENL